MQCQQSCDSNYKISDNTGNYYTYNCLNDENLCNFKKYSEQECLDSCGNLYLENKVCYSDCSQISGKNFLLLDDNNKIQCKEDCDQNLFYGDEKICEKECLFQSFNIIKKGQKFCIGECNNNNYLQLKDNQLYCSDTCENTYFSKHNEDGFICKSKCESPYNYVDNNICYKDNCPSNKPYIKSGDLYLCSNDENCPENNPYSYSESKLGI